VLARLPRLSRAEAVLLALLALWSLLPFAILFVPALGGPSGDERGFFTGTDGIQVADHLQYLAWIRDAGDHVLFSNRFDTVDDPHLFLHPMFVLSGLAWKLGVSLQVALIAWKLAGVALLFWGFAAYVRRTVPPAGAARAATLTLALFFFAPAAPITDWLGRRNDDLGFGSLVMALEQFPAGLVFGGATVAVTLGLMALFLLAAERLLEAPGRPTLLAAISLAGLLVAWLHPWQGLTLLGILAGLWAWSRFDRRYLRLAVPAIATAAPFAYYAVLARTDSAWSDVSAPNGMPHLGTWLFIAFVPTLAAGALGARRPGADVQERVMLLWPVAAVAVYFALDRSFFYHALLGLSLPLAVLGVRAWMRARLPAAAAVVAVILLTLPGMALYMQLLADDAADHFLTDDEAAAMEHLRDSPRDGPVVSSVEFGRAVPAFADRNTWVGHPTWTPGYEDRVSRAEELFDGRLDSGAARALVAGTGATFAVSDCRHDADLRGALGSLVRSVRRFGCAEVYELRTRDG
jgi:hypothetical protein